MSETYRLHITQSFCAAHQLRNYKGKCENLHGHNFDVEIVVQGTQLDPEIEYLIDFGVLKKMAREIIAPLDHSNLNTLASFEKHNPSSELLARHIYKELQARLSQTAPHVTLLEVSVSEKPQQRAVYFE